jgi:DNA-binding Lrp family transcriptional regulator
MQAVNDEVLEAVRQLGRPAAFADIAKALEPKGATRSQVHNAVYRLAKAGKLRRIGSGSGMRYLVGQA